MSQFSQVASNYFELDYPVIPIQAGAKCPGRYKDGKWYPMSGWHNYGSRMPSEDEIDVWGEWPGAGIGLVLGKLSGIVAIDLDYDEGWREKIEELLPPSPCKKKGAKGYTAFYRYNGEPSRKWNADGKSVIEILSDGRQTVMPPSHHPEGAEYCWVTEDSLIDIDREDLPCLPDNFVETLDNWLTEGSERRELKKGAGVWRWVNDAALSRLDEWVPHILPDAARHRGGYRTNAFWRGGDNPTSVNIYKNGIRDFARDEGITPIDLVSAIKKVTAAGASEWLKKRLSLKEPLPDVRVDDLLQAMQGSGEDTPTGRTDPSSVILSPPGLIGNLVDWLNETAIKPQPFLSVAASIPAIGTMLAHRVQSETGLRTNMLVIGTGASGCGKNHPMKQINRLYNECDIFKYMGGGRIMSSTGLFKAVKEAGGIRLFQLDEIGRMLLNTNSEKSSSYQKDIMTMVMEMFTAADGVYSGGSYAERRTAEGHDVELIDQPCLSIYGTTVPERFYQSLNNWDALDGFLPRWLVFHSDDADPEERWVNILDAEDVPSSLVKDCEKLLMVDTNCKPKGNLEAVLKIRPNPQPLSDGSRDMLVAYKKKVRGNRAQSRINNDGKDAIWARAAEHVIKLSMIASAGEPCVTDKAMGWAIQSTDFVIKDLISKIDSCVSDSQVERDVKRIMAIIKPHRNGLKKRDLTRKTQFLKRNVREEIIMTLYESGEIRIVDDDGSEKYYPV